MDKTKRFYEPKGAALEVLQDYRQKWLDARKAAFDWAVSKGADSFLPDWNGNVVGLVYKRRPENLGIAWAKPTYGNSGYYMTRLSGKRAKAVQEEVAKIQAEMDALPKIPELHEVTRSIGLPGSMSYSHPEKGGSGSCSIGGINSWSPIWTSMTSRIFIRERAFEEEATQKIAEGYEVSFYYPEGRRSLAEVQAIIAQNFDILPEHHVQFIQGEEKLAAEQAAAAEADAMDVDDSPAPAM